MKKGIIIHTCMLFFIVLQLNLQAQNCTPPTPPPCDLISNGGFETFTTCPTSYNISNQNDIGACPWCVRQGTPDLFNECSGATTAGVPLNGFGNLSAHGGQGYAGFFAYDHVIDGIGVHELGEALQIPLANSLVAGKTYVLTFWIAIAGCSSRADNITVSVFNQSSCVPTNPIIGTAIYTTSSPILSLTWTQLKVCYTPATSGENYLCFTGSGGAGAGIPTPWPTSSYTFSCGFHGTYQDDGSYYYIDDVSLKPLADAGPDKISCTTTEIGSCSISGASYSWTPSAGLSCTSCASPTANPATTTIYTLTATYTSSDGQSCTALDEVIVEALSDLTISGPSNNCTLPAIFSISNPNAFGFWNLPTGITYFPISQSNQITVTDWGPWTSQASLMSVNGGYFGCSFSIEKVIYPCCDFCSLTRLTDPCVMINNQSLSQLITAPPWSTWYSNGSVASQNSFAFNINGTFVIDLDFEFLNCAHIYLGPDAKIIVKPGHTLTLTSTGIDYPEVTTLTTGCNLMWDGIYVENGGTLVINSVDPLIKTRLMNAKNAIVGKSGSKLMINNGWFYRNNIGIIIEGVLDPNSSITGSDFSSNAATSIGAPYFMDIYGGNGAEFSWSNRLKDYYINPANNIVSFNTRTQIGIEINDATNTINQLCSIGNETSTLNFFDSLEIGIKINNTDVQIRNNSFKECAIGISDISSQANGISSMNVGGLSTGQMNNFLDCQTGIKATDYLKPTIIGNTFSDPFYSNTSNNFYQVSLSCPYASSVVTHNIFNEINYGIKCSPIPQGASIAATAPVEIKDNLFSTPVDEMGFTGIYVANAINNSTFFANLTIQNNHINQVANGIVLQGINSGMVLDNYIDNFTGGSPLSASSFKGISINDCRNSYIKRNTITGPSLPQPTGILLYVNPNDIAGGILGGQIASNHIFNMGSGIMAVGNNLYSRFICNDFNSCKYGFNFAGANIGNQIPLLPGNGPAPMANANQWNSTITAKITGNIVPVNSTHWYWAGASSGIFDPNPLTSMSSNSINNNYAEPLSLNDNDNNNTCNIFFNSPMISEPINSGATNAQILDYFMSPLIREVQIFEDKKDAWDYEVKSYAYQTLKNNPECLTRMESGDSIFVNFFDSLLKTPIHKFEDLRNKIIIGEHIQGLIQVNNEINPTNKQETNRQIVNDIYLRTWAKNSYQFDESTSVILTQIAFQNPLDHGDAVFSSRAMLGIVLDDQDIKSEERISKQSKNYQNPIASDQTEFYCRLFPNPASKVVNYKFKISKNDYALLEVYNILGKLIMEYPLGDDVRNIEIKTERMENGIYFFQTKIEGRLVDTKKLVIIN